ncbi:MAG TPA: hypothetical protein VJU81_17740 [Methylomirabilota bacterium]|nr:hypothetical protein [Methylomirabilota bacterium]
MAVGETPIKAAIKWIDGELRERPTADRLTLIDEAGRRFDLTPPDEEFLLQHFSKPPAS